MPRPNAMDATLNQNGHGNQSKWKLTLSYWHSHASADQAQSTPARMDARRGARGYLLVRISESVTDLWSLWFFESI